jgi:metal-dependent hydrolase (beta-lactamase superfamily II)
MPAHCTGWKAVNMLHNHFGDAFVPNGVGTRIEFTAA